MSRFGRGGRNALTPAEETRLSIIGEEGDTASNTPLDGPSRASFTPPVPPRASHRPFARRWRDNPPRASSEVSPPVYKYDDTERTAGYTATGAAAGAGAGAGVGTAAAIEGLDAEKRARLRDNKFLARRGGWKRLVLILAIVLAIVIALAVGLGVGLTRNHNSNGSPSSSGSGSGSSNNFPVGAYTLNTNLISVSTACTANSATWRCAPYMTYSSSVAGSAAQFDWIVSGTANTSLTISAAETPFSLAFANATLTLVDQGLSTERYTFQTMYNFPVIPGQSITADGMNTECFFNNTLLSGALYTKMTGVNTTTSAAAPQTTDTIQGVQNWSPWMYAIEFNETIAGGQNVPNCYELQNGALSTPVTTGLPAQPSTSQCACVYRNYNL